MARRPPKTNGALIFQEGKEIEGEFYIIAVYDDPASCTYSFAAYELENDCTYTLAFTYSEFDANFAFDSELMNPSNQDGRFHWVILRLDFIMRNKDDGSGQVEKVLVLTPDPTNETVDEIVDAKPKPKGIAPPQTGKIDPQTRAKLLKELDCQDDTILKKELVKSEAARKKFLGDLFKRRQLQQLKARQRLLKADEEREQRLARLEIIRQQQKAKAAKYEEEKSNKANVQKQLDKLLQQQQTAQIRRLIQEKDEESRGMGKEKEASRKKRDTQAKTAAEIKSHDAARAKQMARKRAECVAKFEATLLQRNRQLAQIVQGMKEERKEVELRREEEKLAMIEREWAEKKRVRNEKDRERAAFLEMEKQRTRILLDKDDKRALREKTRWDALKEDRLAAEEEVRRRREAIRVNRLLEWQVDASRKVAKRKEQEERDLRREKNISIRKEQKMKAWRETQFLEMANARATATSPSKRGTAEIPGADQTLLPSEAGETGDDTALMGETAGTDLGATSPTEMEKFQRTFEQQERQKRHAEREERRKTAEAKQSKVKQLGARNPNEKEIEKAREWRQGEALRKKALEDAQTRRELDLEATQRSVLEKTRTREETWDKLEMLRRDNIKRREEERNAAVVNRIKMLPVGVGLPQGLLIM